MRLAGFCLWIPSSLVSTAPANFASFLTTKVDGIRHQPHGHACCILLVPFAPSVRSPPLTLQLLLNPCSTHRTQQCCSLWAAHPAGPVHGQPAADPGTRSCALQSSMYQVLFTCLTDVQTLRFSAAQPLVVAVLSKATCAAHLLAQVVMGQIEQRISDYAHQRQLNEHRKQLVDVQVSFSLFKPQDQERGSSAIHWSSEFLGWQ